MTFVDTRDASATASFRTAVLTGLAPGGGLWMPAPRPPFPDWPELLEMGWRERSVLLLDRMLDGEIPRDDLARAVAEALDFPVPLVPLAPEAQAALTRAGEPVLDPPAPPVPVAAGLAPAPAEPAAGDALPPRLHALELFHGPTLAFKDFGARFFAAVLDLLREPARPVTVLTATSGDTGSAVAHAFWRRPGVRVLVLYPAGRVSALQELQLATLGENVTALAVAGSFDDCQALVKGAFADRDLAARHGLTSANSINVARLLPQTLYYAEAVAQLRRRQPGARPVIAVPSGNFGNLCAGLIARALGLPAAALVAATNANTTVPEHLDGGPYRPRPSIATLSNAMDVGAPSNWERIVHLFGGDLDALRSALRWGAWSDGQTLATIRRLARAGYLADPHGAVACGVLAARLAPGETGIFLATAHPAKFLPVYERLGIEVPLPPGLAALAGRPLLGRPLANDPAALREVIEEG